MGFFRKSLFKFIFIFLFTGLSLRNTYAQSSDQKETDTSRINVLELAGSFFPTPTVGGPQSIPSILNSIRLTSSFVDPLDGIAFAQETGSSRKSSTFSPRIQYSHSFGEDFFIGIVYANNEKSSNSRNYVFTNGLIQTDNTSFGVDEVGFKIGIGPLNYMTNDFSNQFVFTYTELNSKGPYNAFEVRSSIFNLTGSQILGSAFSLGQVEYRTKNYGIGTGFAVSVLDWLNFYLLGEFGFFTGQLKLSSVRLENVITVSSSSSLTPILPGTRTQIIGFQSKSGFTGFVGMNFLLEMGFVWKIMDTLGIKYGGFYQFNFFEIGEITGLKLASGAAPIQLDTVPDLTSALKGKEFGNWGVTIAAVKNF